MIENLVFEGGGIRGIAFGGSLKYMEEEKMLDNIKGLAGSSAGSIISTAIAIGYTSKEIIEIMTNIDFETFKDDSWGIFRDIYRFVTQYGVYKGDSFLRWISNVIEKKTGDKDITFKQIYERYNKTLVITGCCLNKAETVYFHHENPIYENMPVALAVRISMSIPFYWKPVTYKNNVFVDGGVLNNYPIWIFDGGYIGDIDITEQDTKNSKTLGFKLVGENERNDTKLYNTNNQIKSIYDYVKSLLNALLIESERRHIKGDYWDKTICINTFNIKSLDFDLNIEDKARLINEGYSAVKKYFK